MDERLYKAAIEGDLGLLMTLIQQDPLILERRNTTTLETPLHIASMLGHLEFSSELLRRNPKLARELDSRKSCALHLASAGGHVEVVKLLLATDPNMCSVCDRDGRNPVHIAAMMGRIDVLREMLVAARAVMNRGGNILHLCVEFSQFEALKLLVENLDLQDLVSSRDRDGNTVLHLAVAYKQVEMTKYLLHLPGLIDLKATNLSGMTAMDIVMQKRIDERDLEIQETLKRVGAVVGAEQHKHSLDGRWRPSDKKTEEGNQEKANKRKDGWVERQRSSLMVVVVLIATMAFQLAVTPPTYVWGDDQTANPPISNPPTPNDVVEGSNFVSEVFNYLKVGKRFFAVNTTSFIASLSIILMLMSGLPLNNKFVMWVLIMITWVAISAIALSYAVAVILQTPPEHEKSIDNLVANTMFIWICLVTFLLVGHTIRISFFLIRCIFRWFAKMVRTLVRRVSRRRHPRLGTHF